MGVIIALSLPCHDMKYLLHWRRQSGLIRLFLLWKVFFTFSSHSLHVCVDVSLKTTKESLQTIWPLNTLFYPRFMQTILKFIYFRLFHVCVEQCWTCKLQIHYEKPSQMFPEDWNCPNLLGTFWKKKFCKRYVLAGTAPDHSMNF